MLWIALLACASTSCPRGWTADPARVGRLAAMAGRPVEAPVCFGPVEERGVRDDDGRFLLDTATSDALLVARLVHLTLHGPVPAGPRCVEALRREEAEAWEAELATRRRLELDDATCPVATALGASPTIAQIEDWIATADHPRAAGLRHSHERRCVE